MDVFLLVDTTNNNVVQVSTGTSNINLNGRFGIQSRDLELVNSAGRGTARLFLLYLRMFARVISFVLSPIPYVNDSVAHLAHLVLVRSRRAVVFP